MQKLITLLTLCLVFFVVRQARAGDDDGPVLMAEITGLDLPEEDDLFLFRGIVGYTFEPGVQIGGHFSYYRLDKPSVADQVTENACGYLVVCPPGQEFQENFAFWGFGPMIGWNVEFVDDWFGTELATIFSFPVTTGSAGWSFEAGAYLYFSFKGMSDGDVPLYIMGGGHFGHFDFEIDHYDVEANEMMPVGAVMWQF
ncbi:hypothetical protein KJ657_05370 [Patescibacteria group bacterium]|nr:hypothetical protein [Patescibacteria group bacterium]MBU1016487.1 hypothetical protein [Patescibacteria group bacterium]MBU1685134.1 hypothetical protein [Patescibacteria group bacterium]MBU1938634.1 hypothetical protein [Patescibacteria group bacterium]